MFTYLIILNQILQAASIGNYIGQMKLCYEFGKA